MKDLARENEQLKKEDEFLKELLQTVTKGLTISADVWRRGYLELLTSSRVVQDRTYAQK